MASEIETITFESGVAKLLRRQYPECAHPLAAQGAHRVGAKLDLATALEKKKVDGQKVSLKGKARGQKLERPTWLIDEQSFCHWLAAHIQKIEECRANPPAPYLLNRNEDWQVSSLQDHVGDELTLFDAAVLLATNGIGAHSSDIVAGDFLERSVERLISALAVGKYRASGRTRTNDSDREYKQIPIERDVWDAAWYVVPLNGTGYIVDILEMPADGSATSRLGGSLRPYGQKGQQWTNVRVPKQLLVDASGPSPDQEGPVEPSTSAVPAARQKPQQARALARLRQLYPDRIPSREEKTDTQLCDEVGRSFGKDNTAPKRDTVLRAAGRM